jgi:hypothetical protein
VQQPLYQPSTPEGDFPAVLQLSVRGERLPIARDILINLPESILVVMFPNGLIFGNNSGMNTATSRNSQYTESFEYDEDDLVFVDFDPNMLRYVLAFYTAEPESDEEEPEAQEGTALYSWQNPFPDKQALIVLREELDFYAIPPADLNALYLASLDGSSSNARGSMLPGSTASAAVAELKRRASEYLIGHARIFDSLRRAQLESSSERHIGPRTTQNASGAEQQLVEMLCMAGFTLDSEWGFRSREPGRCSITSISMVALVKRGTALQMAAAQKLLLFWRKPARKCWWDGIEVAMDVFSPGQSARLRLWSRRTWTLELALV